MEKPERTGVYLTTRQVLDHPDYVRMLCDRIGLNLAIISFDGGLDPGTVARSPFDGVPLSDECLHGVVARHLDGGPVDPLEFDWVRHSVGPAVRAGGDDETFRAALDRLRQSGVEIWICAGCWTERRLMFCPSNPGVQDWFAALYVDLATRYGVQGLDITHARYPMGSFPRGLCACTCGHCAQTAAAMGYDFGAMKAALGTALQRLRTADPSLLASLGRLGAGLFDTLQLLGPGGGLVDWFRFRAELLATRLQGFRRAVKEAAGAGFVFGTDTHPASLSMFVGHDHAAWDGFSDFASPLVSHISAFVCDTLSTWATFLSQENPGLSERDALQVVYGLTGYDGIGLPDELAGLAPDQPERLAYQIPVEELVMRDLVKARLYLPAGVPSYPIIHGTGWPRQAIDGIVRRAAQAGHNGIIWQGTDELIGAGHG